MKRLALALLLVVAFVAACGVRDDSSGTASRDDDATVSDPEEPVTLTPVPGSSVHDLDGRPEKVRPRPGMADLREVRWEKARPAPGGKSLRVTYWSGVEPCNVLDHVDLRYATSTITITLYEGHDPEAEDVACIEIALQKIVRVRLEEAVAGRKIVDGAER